MRVVPPVDRMVPSSCNSIVSSEELIVVVRFACRYTPIRSRSYVEHIFNSGDFDETYITHETVVLHDIRTEKVRQNVQGRGDDTWRSFVKPYKSLM